jgi:hypothetical protein
LKKAYPKEEDIKIIFWETTDKEKQYEKENIIGSTHITNKALIALINGYGFSCD